MLSSDCWNVKVWRNVLVDCEIREEEQANWDIRKIDVPNLSSVRQVDYQKLHVGAAQVTRQLQLFEDVTNIKMGSNGAATASEHTYVLVTGANR
jgi:hypothetical protein